MGVVTATRGSLNRSASKKSAEGGWEVNRKVSPIVPIWHTEE